jgi:hypothetical protein
MKAEGSGTAAKMAMLEFADVASRPHCLTFMLSFVFPVKN